MASDERGLKRFSGDDADDAGKQLRKWRNWAEAKMVTMRDLSDKQKGPWIYTLLDGRALESVEHLDLTDLMKEDGASTIWRLLAERFPEKESEDQMGEALGEVFSLCAKDGETMQQWSSRVHDVFQKCVRKAKVEFPSPAKGWITLNCAGLSEEQKAIVKAKTQGKLELDVVTAALRSCFPQYRASASKARRPMSTFLVDQDFSEMPEEETDNFADVEAFLADHGLAEASPEPEEFQEDEAAEALAVTWKERRKEISKLQQRRGFGNSKASEQARRSFRVEIEELKRRTRCRKCNRFGHWARECKASSSSNSGGYGGHGPSAQTSSSAPSTHEAHLAQTEVQGEYSFVGMAQVLNVVQTTDAESSVEQLEAGLVSSPGFGVVDSGCGRTLIGRETLSALQTMLGHRAGRQPEIYENISVFRFGNGATETSAHAARIPVGISKKLGVIDAAIIEGRAPLLLGRPTLERLDVVLNFREKTMRFLDQGHSVPMQTNPAGQLLIDVLDFPEEDVNSSLATSQCPRVKQSQPHKGTLVSPNSPQHTKPIQENKGVESNQSVKPTSVPACSNSPLESPQSLPSLSSPNAKKKKKLTLKQKECRCLLAQVKQQEYRCSSQTAVAELFSPPCLAEKARAQGGTGLSFDIHQGCDLLDKETQREVSQLLDAACPELLWCCPPSIHWGGWDYRNRCLRTPLERARLARKARAQVKFCAQEVHRQLKRGGHFAFEHPLGSGVWKTPETQALKRKFGLYRTDMCAYGLCCPDSKKPVQTATGIISSHPSVEQLARRCSGGHVHKVIAGNTSQGPPSTGAGRYCEGFVDAVWEHLGPAKRPANHVEAIDWQALRCECLAGEDEQPEEPSSEAPQAAPNSPAHPEPSPEQVQKVDQALKRLHANLGHPSRKELERILKHADASSLAVQRVSHLQCSACSNHQRPAAPLPANTSRITEFNEKIGVDVKYLPGWRADQTIPCVNIVDYASSLQVMVPIFKRETGELIRAAVRDRWLSWAGPPKVLVLDPARPNLGEVFGDFCNDQGIAVEQTATGSHWQLGKVERHGGWFQNILRRVLDEMRPASEEDYLTCIAQTQSAKNSLLTEAGASPYQHVFGRNPRVPSDLLQDSPHPAASDAVCADPALERAQAVRQGCTPRRVGVSG